MTNALPTYTLFNNVESVYQLNTGLMTLVALALSVAIPPGQNVVSAVVITITGGATRIYSVAVAQVAGVPPHIVYEALYGPLKPTAGVNVYVPSALTKSVPLASIIVCGVTLNDPPPVLLSFNTRLPDAGVPLGVCT